jgi:hypothetical protein
MSKRLVLIGEGHGEVGALPILIRKLLEERNAHEALFVDNQIIRARNPSGLIKWDKKSAAANSAEWLRFLRVASLRKNLGGVLAVFDGDADLFPAGSANAFCAKTAAQLMASVAIQAGAGKTFSLAVVFAIKEFESWIIAGAESLVGKTYPDGRPILKARTALPHPNPESTGKHWLEANTYSYKPSRDQSGLIDLVDLPLIRSRSIRSFRRLEDAIDQLLDAVKKGEFVTTPD